MKSQQPNYGKKQITCDLSDRDRWINGYVRNTLSAKEIEEFEDHLWTCEDCIDEINILQEIQPVIAQDPTFKAKAKSLNTSDLLDKSYGFFWKIAALLVLGLTLGIYLFIGSQPNLNPEELAARMEPSENFEDLRGRNWRSNISDFSPLDSSQFSTRIVFSWYDPHSETLTLTLFDNRDQEQIVRENIRSPQEIDVQKIGLQPGLYYWKLDAESGIRHVGKFFIIKQE